MYIEDIGISLQANFKLKAGGDTTFEVEICGFTFMFASE